MKFLMFYEILLSADFIARVRVMSVRKKYKGQEFATHYCYMSTFKSSFRSASIRNNVNKRE